MPIITSKHKAAHDTSSLWACMRAVPKTLNCTEHPITLAFAVTDFKLQGKTLEKLVLSIAPRPFPPHLDLKAFYVMVSRVRARCGLRLLHRPPQRTGGPQVPTEAAPRTGAGGVEFPLRRRRRLGSPSGP